jgi:hypothetical protein
MYTFLHFHGSTLMRKEKLQLTVVLRLILLTVMVAICVTVMLCSLSTSETFVPKERNFVSDIVTKILYHCTCGIYLCQPVTGQ